MVLVRVLAVAAFAHMFHLTARVFRLAAMFAVALYLLVEIALGVAHSLIAIVRHGSHAAE